MPRAADIANVLQALALFFGYTGASEPLYVLWGAWGMYNLGREKWRPRPKEKETPNINATPGWEEALPEKTYMN